MTSKRFFTVMMILLLLFSLSIGNMGCGSSSRGAIPSGNDNNNAVYYVVSFDSNGGSEVASVKVTSGSTIEAPTAPTKEGYTFAGWYKDNNTFQNIFTFGTGGEKITADITLYAKWVENDTLTAEYALSEIVIGYSTGDNPNYVTQNLTLPTKIGSADISWTSNSGAVASDGTVTRQDADTDVTLTATATYNGKSATRTFNVKVIKKRTRVNSEITPLTIDAAKSGDVTVTKNSSGDVTDLEGQYVSFDIDNADDALDAVTVIKNELGIKNPANELEVAVVTSDSSGAEYQFKQTYNGVKVLGRGVMVSANANGGGDFLHSNLLSSDVIAKADGKADIGQSTAENNAKAAYTVSIEVDTTRTEKVIYSFDDYEADPVYAYIVRAYGTTDDGYIDNTVLVGAVDGAIISSGSNLANLEYATGWGELLGKVDNIPVEKILINGETQYLLGNFALHTTMYTMDLNTPIHSTVKEFIDNQAVTAYINMLEVMQWWKSSFDRDSLDGKGMMVKVVSHQNLDPNRYDDAFWSPMDEAIFLCEQKNWTYSVSSAIDVMTHETTHAVIQYSTGWSYSGISASFVDEAYADIFACIKDRNWTIAEDVYDDINDTYLRNIQFPNDPKAGTKGPINLTDAVKFEQESHVQSLLVSHTAYLMHEDSGIANGLTWEELAKVWYKSMTMGLWHFDIKRKNFLAINYSDVQRCVLGAAKKLVKSGELAQSKIAVIEAAFNSVMNETDYIPITDEYFPDENFRQYISSYLDTDKDGNLSEKERIAVTNINVAGFSISSLKGIECFEALTDLICSVNQLTNLDLSKNTALETLDCNDNQLTVLDTSKNIALIYLNCSSNLLTSINISQNTSLTWLACDYNKLTNLDVSNCTSLEILQCNNNQLTTLNISSCVNISRLYCQNNQLTTLDVNDCDLEYFDCSNNQLITLYIGENNDGIHSIESQNNQLRELIINGQFDLLYYLDCQNNQLTKLDLSDCTALRSLFVTNNKLTTLDLSNSPNLNGSNIAVDDNVTVIYATQNLSSAWSINNKKTTANDLSNRQADSSVIVASIPSFTAERTGEYSFDVSLDKTVSAGSTLIFKNSSEDLSGVFLDENGEKITMPTTTSLDRVKVSANFVAGSSYAPVVAANLNNGSSTVGQGGGCVSVGNEELGLRSLFILLMCAFGVLLRRKGK